MEKLLFKILILVFLIIAVFLVSDYLQTFNNLKLEIRSGKQVYETGEHINIAFELKNIGPETLRINKNFMLHSDLKPHFTAIVDRKELTWMPPAPPAPINESSFVTLDPGETLKNSVDMLDSSLTITREEGYPRPGTYTIRFDYIGITEDSDGKNYKAWKGNISSNAIEILIREKID